MLLSRRELFAISATGALEAQPVRVREASGVFRSGQSLLIADDSTSGEYFKLTLPVKPARFMLLNDLRPQRMPFRQAGLAIDLEAIGILNDGRTVALSERLRSLVGDAGIIAEYDSLLSEVGKRGLEGLAIRPRPNNGSRIAVLWEGGYPDQQSLPGQLRRERTPLVPLVLVHDLPAKGRVGRVRLSDAVATLELQVPKPAGDGPTAQRFRAPDFIWAKIGADWGFLALISSQDAADKPTFQHHWLQRFDMQGRPAGDPLDISAQAPAAHRDANWEGLSWFEPGKSVIVVHESGLKLEPAALVIELPQAWRFNSLVP